MATTNITPVYDVSALKEYVEYGLGEEAQAKRAAGEDRIVYSISNCDAAGLADYARDVCARNHRKREAYHVRMSFSEDDLDPSDPHSAEIAGGLMFDTLRELYPNSYFLIVIHNDGQGGLDHGHGIVVNQDEQTGRALQNTSHKQVSLAADRVCARNGYSVLGQGVSRTWEKTRANGKLTEFEEMLGNTVDFCMTYSKSVDEFKERLDENGVELRESDKGWSYSMVDETDPDKVRRRRRQASKLCHDFTREGVEQYFEDMNKTRSERLKGREISPYVVKDEKHDAVINEPEDNGRVVSAEEEPLQVDSFETREDMCALAERAVKRNNNNLYEQMRERIRTDGVEQFRKDMQRMQQETEKAQEAFHKAQGKADKKSGSNSAVLGKAAQQMLRTSVKQQNTGAVIVALLLMMWAERERQMQRMRQLMQRETLYDKRSVMWTAEKRQHAAETVLKQYEQDVRNGRVYEVHDEHEQVREVELVAQPTQDVEREQREHDVLTEKSVEQKSAEKSKHLDFTREGEPEREQSVSEPVVEREHVEEPRLKVGGGYSTDRSMY